MPMAIQKLISDPVVKLERSPAVEQLIIDYKKREDVKKVVFLVVVVKLVYTKVCYLISSFCAMASYPFEHYKVLLKFS